MSARATGSLELKSWEESPFSESDGGCRLTHASVEHTFRGDIAGEGKLAYVMVYFDERSTRFVGMEHVVGSINGRQGSFVLAHEGSFEDGTADVTWAVVPGSGRGQLEGLRGKGGFVSTEDNPAISSYTLDYDLT